MSSLKSIAAGAILLFAIGAYAQQPAAPSNPQATDDMQAMHARVMAADEHLQALLTKLDLTSDQQSKVIRILYELQDETMRVIENNQLSHDEQLAQIKTLRSMAHNHIYASMNDEQKKTIDEFMRTPRQ